MVCCLFAQTFVAPVLDILGQALGCFGFLLLLRVFDVVDKP